MFLVVCAAAQLPFPSTPIQTQTLEWPIYSLNVREMVWDENWTLCAALLQIKMLHFAHFVQRGFRVWKIDSSHIIRPARKTCRNFVTKSMYIFDLWMKACVIFLTLKPISWISCHIWRKALEALLIYSRSQGAERLEWLFTLAIGIHTVWSRSISHTMALFYYLERNADWKKWMQEARSFQINMLMWTPAWKEVSHESERDHVKVALADSCYIKVVLEIQD